MLIRSEQTANGSSDISIDMDSVQRDQHSQMQLVEQQVCYISPDYDICGPLT